MFCSRYCLLLFGVTLECNLLLLSIPYSLKKTCATPPQNPALSHIETAMPTLPKPYYQLPPEKHPILTDLLAQTIIFICIAPFIFGLPPFVWSEFNSIKDDIWLPSHGVLARNPDAYNIHHATHYTESHFCVSYETQQGQEHEKCTQLLFPFFEPDTDRPLVVHYNPASPDHASTNWGLHMIVTRTIVFLVALLACCVTEFMTVAYVIGKILGKDPGVSTLEEELCAVLPNMVSTLKTQPHNSAYAKSLAAGLDPLVQRYKQAVPESSTGDASRALGEIIVFIDHYRAEELKRQIEFGTRYTDNLRTYEGLVNKLGEANYGSETL